MELRIPKSLLNTHIHIIATATPEQIYGIKKIICKIFAPLTFCSSSTAIISDINRVMICEVASMSVDFHDPQNFGSVNTCLKLSKPFHSIVVISFACISVNIEINDSTTGKPLKRKYAIIGVKTSARHSQLTGFHLILRLGTHSATDIFSSAFMPPIILSP